jgi:tripartite-type tricarboxylate transporter receptor subunit TctC
LLGGQVEGVFADVPAVLGQVRGGRLKALGLASRQRHPLLPEVKTFEEQGFKAVDSNNWYGLFASAKTPPEIVRMLNRAVQTAVADPVASARISQSGAEHKSSSPEELAQLLRTDTDKWAHIVRTRHITVDD